MEAKFGERLRERRMAERVSLRDLAKHMNWSPAYVSDIERGRRPPPSDDNVIKIANHLNIEREELIDLANKERLKKGINVQSERPAQLDTALVLARSWSDFSDDDLVAIRNCVKERLNKVGKSKD